MQSVREICWIDAGVIFPILSIFSYSTFFKGGKIEKKIYKIYYKLQQRRKMQSPTNSINPTTIANLLVTTGGGTVELPQTLQLSYFTTSKNRKLFIVTDESIKQDLDITLFFIHGSMAGHDQYAAQLAYFGASKSNVRVVAYDYYGCGGSDKPHDWDAYSTPNHFADLCEIFDHYKTKRNFIVGHSFGTTLVLKLAVERSGEVEGVICLACGLRNDGGPFLFKFPLFLLKLMQPLLSNGFLERAFHPETLAQKNTDTRSLVTRALARSGRNDMFVAQAFYRQWIWTRKETLQRMPRETRILFICGSDDRITRISEAVEVASYLPYKEQIQFEIVGPCGHQVMEENPNAVNILISKFISSPAATATATTTTLSSL
jgi:pimeloyl-ACP methyl ester carboxylesterase